MENPNCRMVFCLSAVVVYAATAAVWTHPLIFELSSAIPLGSEVTPTVTLFNFWTMLWNRLSVANGFQGYWDAPIFFPLKDTFALSDPQPFTGLVFSFIHLLIHDVVSAYSVLILFVLIANGCAGCYFLKQLGLADTTSLLGGVFALTLPFVMRELGVLQIASIYSLLLSFAFFLRFFAKPNLTSSVGLGVSIGICFLSCSYYGVYLSLLLPFFALYFVRRVHLKYISIIGILLAVVLSLALIFPLALKQGHSRPNVPRSLETIAKTSANPLHYLSPDSPWGNTDLFPWLIDSTKIETPQFKQDLYPGSGLLLLALSSIWVAVRKREQRKMIVFLLVLAVTSILLSLGPSSPTGGTSLYSLVHKYHPGFTSIRSPFRFAVVLQIALLGLAFFSLQSVWQWKGALGKSLSLCILLLSLFEIKPDHQKLYPMQSLIEEQHTLTKIAEKLEPGAIAFYPATKGGAVQNFRYTVRYMLYAVNWNLPMINGYSGFFPKETIKLRSAIRRLAHTGNLEPLRNVGVRYLFVDKKRATATAMNQLQKHKGLKAHAESDNFIILELAT